MLLVCRSDSAELDAQKIESRGAHYRTLSQTYEAFASEILDSIMESEGGLAHMCVVFRDWTVMYPRRLSGSNKRRFYAEIVQEL